MEPKANLVQAFQLWTDTRAASQIFNQYKEESLSLIEEHPYLLVEEVQGIGFKMADQLAERLGIASDAPERLRAALIHCLLEACMEEGDTYIEAKALLERTITLLEGARQIELDPCLGCSPINQPHPKARFKI